MAWWRTFREQTGEAWQQLLYSLELACSGGDDLPWLDTLNFMWNSLPDAEKLTTAERRRLAHSIKQRVRDSVSQHYASELSHKAAIHKRQAAATARLAEQHLQKLADARQRQMEELCTQSRQQSMRLPSIAELEQIDGQWLLPQQGGGQPWPLLQQQQQQQQRALSSQFANRRQQQQQQQQQQGRRVVVVDQAGQRVLRGPAWSASTVSSRRLARVLSGDEAAEDAAMDDLAPCSGDVVIQIPDGCSTSNGSSGSEIEPVAMQQQQRSASALRCIVTPGNVTPGASELQQPLLPPVVESPFAAPQQQQLQQQHGAWWSSEDGHVQQQQQQDVQYEPPTVLVLAAAKLQQQLEEQQQQQQQQQLEEQQQQQQQGPDVACAATTSSSGSGMWKLRFTQPQAAAAAGAQLSTSGFAGQLLQDDVAQVLQDDVAQLLQNDVARAPAGDQDFLQQSGSQLLLQRYLDSSQPAAHADSATAAAAAVAAGCAAVQLCAAEDAREQQQQQQSCSLLAAESEPSSECATATSSTADQYSSCCGGCQSDVACDAPFTPRAAAHADLKVAAPAEASSAADVAAQSDMFVTNCL